MKTRKAYRNLTAFLADTRITQKELAAAVGCSQSQMSRIVAGVVTPGFGLALRISRVARVPMDSFVLEAR